MPLDTNTPGIQVNAIVTPQSPFALTAVCTTANTAYGDTPTNHIELLPASGVAIATSAPRGMRFTSVKALARATVTATELQLFVANAGATVFRLVNSTLMAAYTVAQTTGQTEIDLGFTDTAPLVLAAGERLYAAIGVTNTGIVFRAEGGAY